MTVSATLTSVTPMLVQQWVLTISVKAVSRQQILNIHPWDVLTHQDRTSMSNYRRNDLYVVLNSGNFDYPRNICFSGLLLNEYRYRSMLHCNM